MESKAAVKAAIDAALSNVADLESMISDFKGNNDQLFTMINEYLESLKALHATADELQSRGQPIEVPLELLRYVDDGGNPDAFVRLLFSSVLQENQVAKGKVEAFRELRDALVDKMAGPFPQQLRDYQELRGLPAGQVEPK